MPQQITGRLVFQYGPTSYGPRQLVALGHGFLEENVGVHH